MKEAVNSWLPATPQRWEPTSNEPDSENTVPPPPRLAPPPLRRPSGFRSFTRDAGLAPLPPYPREIPYYYSFCNFLYQFDFLHSPFAPTSRRRLSSPFWTRRFFATGFNLCWLFCSSISIFVFLFCIFTRWPSEARVKPKGSFGKFKSSSIIFHNIFGYFCIHFGLLINYRISIRSIYIYDLIPSFNFSIKNGLKRYVLKELFMIGLLFLLVQ